ncbi:MAG: tRNA(fMet)-specific endonuclease VapC [Candidatus Heimdallarchaeota archaeon LC_3]|nr:MAG: tRNA(fMet)-specific endonuclease VapC [Candidatus Heimdallarchaeota archaeon LC_3]
MVIKIILLDTGVIAAFFNKRDLNHDNAKKLLNNLRRNEYGTGIITDYILDETVTLLYARTRREDLALKAGELILEEKFGKFFPISYELVIESWKNYQNYVSKGLSFTDCTLITVGQFLDCNVLLTFSKEFTGLVNIINSA